MTVRRHLVAALVPLVVCPGATALAQRPVTRAEAVAAALAHGPRLALARADTAAAGAALTTARTWANPLLSLSYSKDTPQRHVMTEVPLDLPWLRSARIAGATAARRAAADRFALERAGVVFDAEAAYTTAAMAVAHARLSRQTALEGDSLLRIARARRDAGDASDLDVALAEVASGQQTNQALADSLAALGALLDLEAVMGDSSGDTPRITLADTLVLVDTAAARTARAPLAVSAAARSVDAADLAVTAARRSVFGTASVQLGFDTHDPMQSGVLPTIGIAVPIPLFNQGGGEVAAARAGRERARAELSLARVESARDIARAARARELALARAERDRALYATADRVAAMSLTAYREGAAGLASVLEARRSARELMAQYIDDAGQASLAAAALRLLTASSPPS